MTVSERIDDLSDHTVRFLFARVVEMVAIDDGLMRERVAGLLGLFGLSGDEPTEPLDSFAIVPTQMET